MGKESKKKQPVRAVVGGAQGDLFEPERSSPGRKYSGRVVGFDDRDPSEIFIGEERLDRYLKRSGLGWILIVRDFVRDLPWESFESRYELSGRRPYSPASMMALILYAIMQGRSSLREIERLARVDLGAMWVSGGICPDHASIGRFLQLHAEELTEAFFERLTQGVCKRLGSQNRVVAGDGTVLEAAGSRFRILKLEAARKAAGEARQRAQEAPDDEQAQAAADQATRVEAAAERRAHTRQQNGFAVPNTLVCATEPDAAVLRTKRGFSSPGYTPSVLANEDRVIIAQYVDPTSEQAAVEPLLAQAQRVVGPQTIETALFDGNYFTAPTIKATLERDIGLLCPTEKSSTRSSGKEQIGKKDFLYDSKHDRYICPQGKFLFPGGTRHDKRRDKTAAVYSTGRGVCENCPLRERCIKSSKETRRRIYRDEWDDARDVLRQVMRQPGARRLFRQRKAMVEPVFSEMRGAQGLHRFHRHGEQGAKLEFSLHASAYNLRRLVARANAGAVLWIVLMLWLLRGRRALASLLPRLALHPAPACP